AMRDGAHGIAFAIPADVVKEFLRRHLSAKAVSGIDHGLTCTERVEEEGALRQRVVVAWLDPQGLAAAAGVKPGDRILTVARRTLLISSFRCCTRLSHIMNSP